MSLTSSHFSIEELESRFEMAPLVGRCNMDTCTELEPGSRYGYYGDSWGNLGSGSGYVGVYTNNNGHAMLDDGTYTDQTSGSFPTYEPEGPPTGPGPRPARSFCVICRCRI